MFQRSQSLKGAFGWPPGKPCRKVPVPMAEVELFSLSNPFACCAELPGNCTIPVNGRIRQFTVHTAHPICFVDSNFPVVTPGHSGQTKLLIETIAPWYLQWLPRFPETSRNRAQLAKPSDPASGRLTAGDRSGRPPAPPAACDPRLRTVQEVAGRNLRRLGQAEEAQQLDEALRACGPAARRRRFLAGGFLGVKSPGARVSVVFLCFL